MFRCQNCQKVSTPNEKMVRVVTQVRPRTYYNDRIPPEPTGQGHEIVSEKGMCKECAEAKK